VARDLAKIMKASTRRDGYYEGDKIWVSWCVGHMVQLSEPAAYDEAWKRWSRASLPMLPETFKLSAIGRTRDQLDVLKKLLKRDEITEVVNACDAGREGELIFRYVYDVARAKKPVKRLWLASLTPQAVRAAWGVMKPGTDYDALGDAARCRSEADWLVGLNATRAMTIQGRASGGRNDLMSVGRVQTPTLAMIVEREREIEDFTPETFWQVYAKFDAGEQETPDQDRVYEGCWTAKRGGKDRFDKKEDAEAVVAAIEGKQGEVTKLVQKDIKERPPLLFDLTSLQRLANKRFAFSAQHTLDLAQALYEKHKLITYPRTDSNHLTQDMVKGLVPALKACSVGGWAAHAQALVAAPKLRITKRVVNDDEVGDHHAIIPTDKAPNLTKLTKDEQTLYELVCRRFIAAFFPDAVFATTRAETTVDKKHMFVTKGRVRKVAGWQEVEPPARYARKGKKGKSPDPTLPRIDKNASYPVDATRLHEGQTKPPKRYSEDLLLGAMERAGRGLDDAEMRRAMKESGLGTPATRASIIETLLRREYVRRAGKNIVPTPKGRALVDAIPSDALKSPELTGEWESKLSKVAGGKMSREEFMKGARELTASLIDDILSTKLDLPTQVDPDDVLGTCPVCKTPVTEGFKAYSCGTGRDCSFVIFKKVAGRTISKQLVKLLLSGKRSKTLKGFRSTKTKKSFQAALELDAQGKVKLVFDDSSPRAPKTTPEETSAKKPAGKAPAKKGSAKGGGKVKGGSRKDAGNLRDAGKTVVAQPYARDTPRLLEVCPKCEQGKVIRGKRAWGCSRWREGCDWVSQTPPRA
jgi:DNA topoisomerase-3